VSAKLQPLDSKRQRCPIDLGGFPWYKWFPAKFALSEESGPLSLAEEGAFHRLLDNQWINGSIPPELEKLALICKRIPDHEMELIWVRLKPFFEPDPNNSGRLINRDLWNQMNDVSEVSERQARNGRAGAKKRWGETSREGDKEPIAALKLSDSRVDTETKTPTDSRWVFGGEQRGDGERGLDKGHAMIVFARLRGARTSSSPPHGGTRYSIPVELVRSLDDRSRAALEGIGGPHILANAPDDKLTILRAQFAEMFLSTSAVRSAATA
jgi:uncharacterized protein YdaU (DUF1376 family)